MPSSTTHAHAHAHGHGHGHVAHKSSSLDQLLNYEKLQVLARWTFLHSFLRIGRFKKTTGGVGTGPNSRTEQNRTENYGRALSSVGSGAFEPPGPALVPRGGALVPLRSTALSVGVVWPFALAPCPWA